MAQSVNQVRPFLALHYDPKEVDNIGLCLAQPYDVISPEQQESYYRQHPRNVIRLILNREHPGDNKRENPYTRYRTCLQEWKSQGVIRETARPSFWVYEPAFDIPAIGRKPRLRASASTRHRTM